MKVIFLALLIALAFSSDTQPPKEATLDLREDVLVLREKLLQDERFDVIMLALQMTSLARDMREVVDAVKALEIRLDEQARLVEGVDEKLNGVQEAAASLRDSELKTGEQLLRIGGKLDLIRSEVRLISHHKLAWQNSTYDNAYHVDFLMDGVYTLESSQHAGRNPMQRVGVDTNGKDSMISIDLGGFFKIHTVKLWNRLDSREDSVLGVQVYVDDRIIGSIHDVKSLYNVRVSDGVYGNKVWMKQTLPHKHMSFIEVQVFGSGPFGTDEAI